MVRPHQRVNLHGQKGRTDLNQSRSLTLREGGTCRRRPRPKTSTITRPTIRAPQTDDTHWRPRPPHRKWALAAHWVRASSGAVTEYSVLSASHRRARRRASAPAQAGRHSARTPTGSRGGFARARRPPSRICGNARCNARAWIGLRPRAHRAIARGSLECGRRTPAGAHRPRIPLAFAAARVARGLAPTGWGQGDSQTPRVERAMGRRSELSTNGARAASGELRRGFAASTGGSRCARNAGRSVSVERA